MRNVLLTVAFLIFPFLGIAQSYWEHFDTNDGLLSNDVKSIAIENYNSIYLGTANGLSHYNQGTFTNYTTANSGLNSNNIIDMELNDSLLFLHTDMGLTTFDGFTFTNYTINNGLLSNNIKEIQLASNGILWVGTPSGVSYFDGTQFTNFPNKVAHALGIDSLNRVYIINKPNVIGNETATNLQIYDGISWSSHTIFTTGGGQILSQPNFRLLANGDLILSAVDRAFYKLEYNLLSFFVAPVMNQSASPRSNAHQVEMDNNGELWIGGRYINASSNKQLLFKEIDNAMTPYHFSNEFSKINFITYNANTIAFATEVGFFIGSRDVKPVTITNDISTFLFSAKINTRGSLFERDGNPGFELPRGSNRYGIYSNLFIVGAKKNNSNTFNVYPDQQLFGNQFEIGPRGTNNEVTRSFMVKIAQFQIDRHRTLFNDSSYVAPESITKWPAKGDSTLGEPSDLAPFIDVNNNGCYDPENGDYPVIKGDEAIYWINRPPETSALNDLEYHYMVYTMNNPNVDSIKRTLFVDYTVINRSNTAYDSIKVGIHLDTDIGGASDDYVGCDSLNNIMYGYNSDSHDGSSNGQPAFGGNPPAVGLKLVNENLDSYVSYHSGSGAHSGPPTSASEFFNYMNGRWKNGAPITYGGNGLNQNSNQLTKHMFTGKPQTNSGWTESSASMPAGDKSAMGSVPYFSLQPNERKTITMAIGYAFANDGFFPQNHVLAIPAMSNTLNYAKAVYDSLQPNNGVLATNYNCPIIKVSINEAQITEESVSLYPVPTTGAFTIESDVPMKQIEIIDIRGTRISEYTLAAQSNLIEMSLPSSATKGLYFVRIQFENQQWISKKIMLTK